MPVKRPIQVNICFDCQRAVGGCSWSEVDEKTGRIRFEPPPGCTAEPAQLYHHAGGRKYDIDTYHITACPLFIPDEPGRKRVNYDYSFEEET